VRCHDEGLSSSSVTISGVPLDTIQQGLESTMLQGWHSAWPAQFYLWSTVLHERELQYVAWSFGIMTSSAAFGGIAFDC
jgi:hypothetical protein